MCIVPLLHHAFFTLQQLLRKLRRDSVDVFARDRLQDTPLHTHARSDNPERLQMLIGLLTFSKLGRKEIDVKALYGNTALHIAAKVSTLLSMASCIKRCVVFSKVSKTTV